MGTVKVWFYIDEAGEVVKTQVHTRSGHAALDDAAISIAQKYDFSPAESEGEAIPVWIAFDITFKTH